MRQRWPIVLAALLTAACTSSAASKQPAPAPSDPTNPVARGEQVFGSHRCVSCHTLQDIPTARGTVGPDLSHVGGVAAQRKPGVPAEDYLRESIVDPDAFTAPGYPRGVMPRIALDQQQVDDLVAFLRAQQ